MISFIFPAFNEGENLKRFPAEVIPVFDALREEYEIVVVDDGSKDDTAHVAQSLGPKVRLVPHERNQGLGAAVRTGIAAARGDLVVTMDSDLTFAPSLVKDLLARFKQGDVDVVSGSPKLAGFGADIPTYRVFISHLASLVYRVVMGARVSTVSPIFRLYKREQLVVLPLQATGFDINAEILFFLLRDKRRVAEIPAPLTQRIHGESKLNYKKEMIRHAKLIWRMLMLRLGLRRLPPRPGTRLKLLFITPKIDEAHDDLAFASLWARGFQDAGFDVEVICTNLGAYTQPMPVHSLGGEKGASRLLQFFRFQRLITALEYDRVFVHMTPRWLGAGTWLWLLRRVPTYLWFTHYTRTLSLKIGEHVVKRMFCATKDSLPQYEGDVRKVVTGHGIDTAFWNVPELPDAQREPATHLLAVHRISRSKRFELVLKALALLPSEYRLTHYGRPQDPTQDPAYAEEIERLTKELNLADRVTYMGSVPMPSLRSVYPRFRTFINMVPRTIDKTALEAMFAGLTPILSPDQSDAIGWPEHPVDETPESIAAFITGMRIVPAAELRAVVERGHSLKALIEKMAVYIRPGN